MKLFNKFWSGISNLGVTHSISIPIAKRLKVFNQLNFIAIILTLFYIFIYKSWNVPHAFYVEIIFITFYIALLIVSKTGYPRLSKFLFVLFLNIHMYCLCLCFGEESQMHLLFIPVSALPLVLFDFKKIKTIASFLIFSIGLFVLLFATDFASPLADTIPPDLLDKIRIMFNITAIFCEIIIIYFFISSYDRAEKVLDESNILLEEQFQAIFNNSFDALFLVDAYERTIIKANKRAAELFEMENENDFCDQFGLNLHKEMPSNEYINVMQLALVTTGEYEAEVLYKTARNNEFWGALAIRIIKINGKRCQSVRVTDITAQKKFEKQIQVSLHEKEILLAEIHHRVKNNLAVVSGLLGLQAMHVEDEKAKLLFEESRHRIHSMALIHDKLYQHETLATIDFCAYINDLVAHIKNSYFSTVTEVTFSVTCSDIFLDIKNAVPCGLILNELISNSCKHAFKDRTKGEIKIVCTKMGGKFTMMASDDGIGFDVEEGLNKSNSLGLTLIKALGDQVSGNVKTSYTNGTAYYISFEA